MENLYLNNLKEDDNYFLTIINSDDTNISRKKKIASIFHQFKSILNDDSISESDKKIVVEKWEDFYSKSNFNQTEKNQVDKYLVEHIINLQPDNYNYNILNHVDKNNIEEYYNVLKREVNKGNIDVIFSLTRHYSEVNSKGFSFSNFDFNEEKPNIENTISEKENLSKSLNYNDDLFKELLSYQSEEDKSELLNRFIEIYNQILNDDEYNDPEYINSLDTVAKEISSDLNNYPYLPLSEEQKRFHRHGFKNFDYVDQTPIQNLDNSLNEIDSDFKEECYEKFLRICKENNIIQKNKIPLVTSDLVFFDPDFKEGEETSKKILKLNKLTGSLTIPSSGFNDPMTHELSALHARSKGWDTVAIVPPKKGTINDKKEFMKNAILSMYNIGEYDSSEIQVPKKWEKFKNDIISQLKNESQIKQKLSKEDFSLDSDLDIEPRLDDEPLVTPTSDVNKNLTNENSLNNENKDDKVENSTEQTEQDKNLNDKFEDSSKEVNIENPYEEENLYHQVPEEGRTISNETNSVFDESPDLSNDFDESLIETFNREGDIEDIPDQQLNDYFHNSFDLPEDISRDLDDSNKYLQEKEIKKQEEKTKKRNKKTM